jgi:hypothetical protein
MPTSTIKQNEKIGKSIEDILAQSLNTEQPYKYRNTYDLETLDSIIEVKSHRNKNISHRKYNYNGRFQIIHNSHIRLKEKSIELSKQPLYIFVIYENTIPLKIIKQKQLTWKQVDELLKNNNPYTRKDGTIIHIIQNKQIFV